MHSPFNRTRVMPRIMPAVGIEEEMAMLVGNPKPSSFDAVDRSGQQIAFLPPAELSNGLPVAATDLDDAARERELGMLPVEEVHYEPTPVVPMPEYVQHSADATPTGIVVGEAIVKEYENAAREIEALGAELKAEFDKAHERQEKLAAALTNLTDTAKAYREEAKRVFEQMQACASKADAVTAFAQEVRSKIAAPVE